MSNSARILAVAGVVAAALVTPSTARAQECSRAVVFTLPGVTWEEVERVGPPNLLALVDEGAAGSISVRTISSRTSYASGLATIGAGSRVDAPRAAGGSAAAGVTASPQTGLDVDAVEVLERLADDAGYDAAPGAMASALGVDVAAIGNADRGLPPGSPTGYGRWTTLAAMDQEGDVDAAWVGPDLLQEDPGAPFGIRTDETKLDKALDSGLRPGCGVTIIDQGDLARADEWAVVTDDSQEELRAEALEAADRALGRVIGVLDDEDLLLVVSPTSPWWEEDVHLGVALARGPGFAAGSTISSASTRRSAVVTLPDIAPTILEHMDGERPASMTGRPWFDVPTSEDRVSEAVDFDRESIFVENVKGPASVAFVVVQVLVYLLAIFFFTRRKDVEKPTALARIAEVAALAIVAFPATTYAAGAIESHSLGTTGFVLLLVSLNAALVVAAVMVFKDPLDRLLLLTSVTVALLFADLLTGGRLQINTVLGYSPVVAGRFAGLGNIAFAVLGTTALLTGVLIAHKWQDKRWSLAAAGTLFAVTVVVDGAPMWGSDVGGILALVPSLGLTWLLLAGRRPNLRVVALGALAAVLALGAFLAFDLSRPVDEQTHLARLFEDVRERGGGVFWDTIERKAEANARLFRTSIWTFFVPPALLAMALLMRRPRGRWEAIASTYPRLRAGLVGGLVLAVIGFAVNDSGIVIPAVVLSFLVPTAVLTHLKLDESPPDPRERPA